MRKASFYLIYMMVLCLFTEGALQAFYRVTSGDWLPRRVVLPIFDPDERRVYKVKPNLDYAHITNEFNVTYYTDNFGFRSVAPDHVTETIKPENVYRVMFLGPSFSFGTASDFEDMYVTRIAEQLKVAGKTIEVINVGTPAQPPRWQLCWVRDVAPRFGIDLVVQTSYGNSVFAEPDCDKTPPLPIVDDGYLYKEVPTLTKRVKAASKKSAIIFYGWYLYQILDRSESTDQGLGTDMYVPVVDGENSEAKDKSYFKALSKNTYEDYRTNIRKWLGQNTKVVILHFPFGYVVHPEDRARFGDKGSFLSREKLLMRSGATEEAMAEISFPFINATSALLERAEEQRQYNFIDVHFTLDGNKTLADYAAPILQEVIDGPSG